MAKAEKPKNFEDAIEELETILDQIERGEASLEDSITHYERGVSLVKHCQGVLDRAEKRIRELTQQEDGSLKAGEAAE
jgi:exodeoxyribonuclease VII small subunit